MKGEKQKVVFNPFAEVNARVYKGVLGYHRTLSKHITEFGAPLCTITHVPSRRAVLLTHDRRIAKQAITTMLAWPIDWLTIHLAEDDQADKLRLEQELTDLIDGQKFFNPKKYGFKKEREDKHAIST